MSINNDLAVIYQSCKRSNEQFIAGGVVNEEEYEAAPCKLLVLLKEANDKDNADDWSLIDLINDQIKAFEESEKNYLEIWRRIGLLSLGLKWGFDHYHHQVLGGIEQDIAEGLSAIAVTNLKKCGGGGSSNYDEIKQYAARDKDLWSKEVEIMKPDIVLCGGTFSIVCDLLGFEVLQGPSGADYGKALRTVFVDFPHPMYQISPKIYYAYFIETMRELERIGAYKYKLSR
jgi:hypothetical protein